MRGVGENERKNEEKERKKERKRKDKPPPGGLLPRSLLFSRHTHNRWRTVAISALLERREIDKETAADNEMRALFTGEPAY